MVQVVKSPGAAADVPATDPAPIPRSVQIASRGIRTDVDAANFFSALTSDIMTEGVKVKTANAACNAMGKLLKIVDMRQRYGNGEQSSHDKPVLRLADPDDESREHDDRRRMLLEELARIDSLAKSATA